MWNFIILMALFALAYAPIYWAATPELRRHIGPLFVGSVAVLLFAGLFVRPMLFYFICVVVMVTTTRGRVDALCRYVLLVAMIPSTGQPVVIGGLYLLNISTLDSLAIGLWLALALKPDRERTRRFGGVTIEDMAILLLYFALSFGATRLTGSVSGLGREMAASFIGILFPYLLMRRYLRGADDYRMVMACVAVAAALLSVYGIYEAHNGWSVFTGINDNLGASSVGLRNLMVRGEALRASTTMQGALMLGCFLAFGWIAMACSRKFVRNTYFWIAGMGVVLLGELASQSRGSLACLALGGVLLLAVRRRLALAVGFCAAAGALGGLAVTLGSNSDKIAGFLQLNRTGQDDVYDYRQLLLQRGMEEAAKHRWTGTDLASVIDQLADITQGQRIVDFVNTYLVIYLVSGLFGFVFIAAALGMVVVKLVKRDHRLESIDLSYARSMILAVIVILLVSISFMSFIDRIPFLMALSLAGARLVHLERRRRLQGDPKTVEAPSPSNRHRHPAVRRPKAVARTRTGRTAA